MSETPVTVRCATRTYVREDDGYYARDQEGRLVDCLTDADVVWALDKVALLQQQRDALAAELEAVRRVEAWPDDAKGRDVVWDDGYWWARQDEFPEMLPIARASTIPALGRALAAQEETDGK